MPRIHPALLLSAATLLLAACGDSGEAQRAASTAGSGADLTGVKDYLTEHTAELALETEELKALGQSYHDLAEATGFDYEAMMRESGAEVEAILADSKDAFSRANPAYEEMEGIVAGVPRLAQYDVDIDAGADASDPENAVSFSLELASGETVEQPGNAMFVTETSIYGTNPEFLADTEQDVDGDGKEEFGEGIPDAEIYLAMVEKFDQLADDLDADAGEFEPTASDALTAITVMTPTMSEYFEAWKNSRFIAGDAATEVAFVDRSRLHDIADILEGIDVTWSQIEPLVAEEDPAQAEQTGAALDELLSFVAGLRDREDAGKEYTAEEADILGSEAQRQAEAIAGQVTQAAKRLGIELQT